MYRTIAISGIAAAFLSGPAAAQGLFDFDPAEGGPYIGGYVGAAYPGDAKLDGRLASTPPGTTVRSGTSADFDESTAIGVFAGYQLPFKYWTWFHPRLEFEISGLESDLDSARINGEPQAVSGDVSTTFFLVNNYSDIVWRTDQKLVPYIGGGLGLATVDVSARTVSAGDPAETSGINDDTTALAGTFAGGLSYRTSPRFEIYTEARYYTIYGVELTQQRLTSGAETFRGDVEDDLDGFQLQAGVRLRF